MDEVIALVVEDKNPPGGEGGTDGDAEGGTNGDATEQNGKASAVSMPSQGTIGGAVLSPNTEERKDPVGRIGGGLSDAARRFSFPLMLAASVAAFLLMQSRIDRKDPKLAAAPIDARDDVVRFQ